MPAPHHPRGLRFPPHQDQSHRKRWETGTAFSVSRTIFIALSMSRRIFPRPRRRWSLSFFFSSSKVSSRERHALRKVIHSRRRGRTPRVIGVEFMMTYSIGRCHKLKHDRAGTYAVDLTHPYRLVFEVKEDEIQIANILEVVDYH